MTVRGWRLAALAAALVAGAVGAAENGGERSEARMRKDITFLASEECEGRGPYTKGINKAAAYIAAAFQEAGLKGAMPDGSYYQPFTMSGPAKLGTDTVVRLRTGHGEPVALKIGDDFQPINVSGNGTVDAPIVFVGFGVTCKDPKYDDYQGVDVTGQIALMIRRSPRFGQKDKEFSEKLEEHAALADKLENAAKHGAKAVILVNDTSEADDRINPFVAAAFGAGSLPFVHIKRELAEGMVKAATGKTLTEVETAINADLKPLSAPIKDAGAKVTVTVSREKYPVKNVVGVLEGAGPLASETVVIGAHYDHLGFGDRGSLSGGSKAMHPGADDNGSGSTSVIELARRFGAMKDRQGRRMLFMTFSGEEQGLLGSAHYCKEPIFPLEKTVCMINLDMVGRLTPDKDSNKDKLTVYGTGSAKSFDALVEDLNKKYDFKLKKIASGMGPSDQQSFYLKKVPVLFFFTDTHKDYHKPSDTADKINLAGMRKVVDLTEEVARIVTADEKRPEYVATASPASAPGGRMSGPRMGIMPDYDDEKDGVLLTGVSPGGAAEKAGLKEGDRIVEIGGKPVKNVTSYMTVMSGLKKNEPVDVVYVRKGERTNAKVTPQ